MYVIFMRVPWRTAFYIQTQSIKCELISKTFSRYPFMVHMDIKSQDWRARLCGCKSQLYQLLAVWPWASYDTFLGSVSPTVK